MTDSQSQDQPQSTHGETGGKPFYKRGWFWILIALVSMGMSQHGTHNETEATASTQATSSVAPSAAPSAPEPTLRPDRYPDILKLGLDGMNWSEAYQKLDDAQIEDNDYVVDTSDGKSVWMKDNWRVQTVSDSDGVAHIMIEHLSEEEQSTRNKLESARNALSSKVSDAHELVDSSTNYVTDESTRDNLSGKIDEASSFTSDDPQRYDDEINSLQAAMTAVNVSSDQKVQSDLESSTASSAQPQQDQDVYYPNCTAVRAAGKAPLYSGQPGYRYQLDRDNDGIACE
jgi:hypothetical protein